MKEKILKLLLVNLLLITMSACNQVRTVDPNHPDEEIDQGEEVNQTETDIRDYMAVSYSQAMTSLHPNQAISEQDFHTLQLIGEGLYRKKADNQIVEGVVDHVEREGNKLLFTIKDQAKWSDQKDVLAEDFVLSWQYLVGSSDKNFYSHLLNKRVKNASAIQKGEMKPEELGVKALDDKLLEVTLEDSFNFSEEELKKLLSLAPLYPLPSHQIEDIDDYGTKSSSVLSNGPYQISDWQQGWEKWNLDKNYEYWNEEQYPITNIQAYSFNQAESSLQALDQRIVDIAFEFTSLNQKQYPSNYLLITNLYNKDLEQAVPMEDRELRELLYSAIDQSALSKQINIPNSALGQVENKIDRDQLNEQFQAYLESEDKQGLELEIVIDLHQISYEIASCIQSQLHHQFDHLAINIKPLQTHDLKKRLLNQEYDLTIFSQSIENDFLNMKKLESFTSDQASNLTSYNNNQYDQLFYKNLKTNETAFNYLVDDYILKPLITVNKKSHFSPAVKNPQQFHYSVNYDFSQLEFESGEWTRPILEQEEK